MAGRLLLNARLNSHSYRIAFGQIVFVVDTGSNETFISEGDALRLNIPINKLSFERHIRMAGSTFELLKTKSLSIIMRDEENKTQKIDLDFSYVARGTKKSDKEKNIALSFPSILGLDFLEKNKFSLVVTPHMDLAYLEKE
ncbi:hypothetical protein HYX17_04800 [Candidatus Woesearchaeota archaeon]|nr:hypothetical protein [Candidatus Woesearchaeota archaeon]